MSRDFSTAEPVQAGHDNGRKGVVRPVCRFLVRKHRKRPLAGHPSQCPVRAALAVIDPGQRRRKGRTVACSTDLLGTTGASHCVTGGLDTLVTGMAFAPQPTRYRFPFKRLRAQPLTGIDGDLDRPRPRMCHTRHPRIDVKGGLRWSRVVLATLAALLITSDATAAAPSVSQMLAAAQARDETAVLEAKRQLEAGPATARGDRKTARARNEEALKLMSAGRHLDAVEILKTASVADPGDVEVLNNLGYAQHMAGQLADARRSLERTLQMAPGRAAAWGNLAEVLGKVDDESGATAALRLVILFSRNQQKSLAYIEEIGRRPDPPRALATAAGVVLKEPAIALAGTIDTPKVNLGPQRTTAVAAAEPQPFEASSPKSPAPASLPSQERERPVSTSVATSVRVEGGYLRVTGSGATLAEARKEAVRLALQQTMKQLVIVDRVVENDELVLDRLLSTMNGFVEDFRDVRIAHDVDHYQVEADVKVSSSGVQNYLAAGKNGGLSIKGQALALEIEREKAQRDAHGEIVARAFRGFPKDVVTVELERVAVADDDPDKLEIDLRVALDKGWLEGFENAIAKIALNKAPENAPRHEVCFDKHSRSHRPRCYLLPQGESPLFYSHSTEQKHQALWSALFESWFAVGVRFIDRYGQNVQSSTEHGCLLVDVNNQDPLWDKQPAFSTEAKRLRLQIPARLVDLSRVAKVVVVPVVGSFWKDREFNRRYYVGDVSRASQYREAVLDVCTRDLDEAARRDATANQNFAYSDRGHKPR